MSSYLLFVAVAVSVWMPLLVVGLMAAAVVGCRRYRRGCVHVQWRALRATAIGTEKSGGHGAIGSAHAR